VLTAEFDILADQGRAYAESLETAGVPVVQSCYPGMLHDFVTLPGLFTPGWKAIDEITEALRRTFERA
jgi:acetyl esterase